MKLSRKAWNWIYSGGILVFLVAIYLAGTSAIFYAWLNAYDPEQYPAEKVGSLAYFSLGLTVIFICLLIYCIYKLVKNMKKDVVSEESDMNRLEE